ncbi:MAG: hypothetical protein HDS14_08020 [Bacteroides sp.]|nr:hypothetical protein [Bacteroides sp.]
MKRYLSILTLVMTATLTGAGSAAIAATPDPDRPQGREERDSLTRKEKMALELIESVNQLSRTASRLSETALELINRDNPPRENHSRETNSREVKTEGASATKSSTPLSPDSLELRERALAERERLVAQKEANLDAEIGDYIIRKWGSEAVPDSVKDGIETEPPAEPERHIREEVTTTSQGVVRKSDFPAPEDRKVIFRGDTLNMVLRERNFGRFDRKLFNYLAVPRGIWKASLTASYGELSTQDMEMLDLVSNINLGGYIFSIKPAISYFIRDNIAIGCRLAYTRGHGYVDGFNVDIDEDMNFSLNDIDYQSESYRAGITLTRYLGLSPRSRFHLTNEVELAFASGNNDFQRPFNGQLKKTHTTTMSVGVTYSPGVSVQIMRNVCFDLSFGVFGFQLKSERQSVDGVDMGRRTTSGANFRFNIFNLSFGIGVTV